MFAECWADCAKTSAELCRDITTLVIYPFVLTKT